VSYTNCLGKSRMTCTSCQAPIDIVLNKVNEHSSQVDAILITKPIVLPPADCRREVKAKELIFLQTSEIVL
jgi:hypothetical protein